MQRGPDQLACEADMALGVVREAEVGAAGILGPVERIGRAACFRPLKESPAN